MRRFLTLIGVFWLLMMGLVLWEWVRPRPSIPDNWSTLSQAEQAHILTHYIMDNLSPDRAVFFFFPPKGKVAVGEDVAAIARAVATFDIEPTFEHKLVQIINSDQNWRSGDLANIVYECLGVYYAHRGQLQKARSYLKKITTANYQMSLLLTIAVSHAERGERGVALAYMQQAFQTSQRIDSVWGRLALERLVELGYHREVFRNLAQAQLDPSDFVKPLLAFMVHKGMIQEVRHLMPQLNLSSERYARLALAVHAVRQKHPEEAIQLVRSASLGPSAQLYFARVLHQHGYHSLAERIHREARNTILRTDLPEFLEALAADYALRGETETAKKLLPRIQSHHSRAYIRSLVALHHIRRGEWTRAKQEMNPLIGTPEYADLQLVMLVHRLRRREDAQARELLDSLWFEKNPYSLPIETDLKLKPAEQKRLLQLVEEWLKQSSDTQGRFGWTGNKNRNINKVIRLLSALRIPHEAVPIIQKIHNKKIKIYYLIAILNYMVSQQHASRMEIPEGMPPAEVW